MAQSSISVVIPAYNGSRFIREALDSVFCQTLMPDQVIVVDDASTDGTAEIAAGYQGPPAVRVIRRARNSGGPACPLNHGIRAATGEYIAVLDQDDVFTPQKLEQQAGVLEEHPQVSLVFGMGANYEVPDQPIAHPWLLSQLESEPRMPGERLLLPGRVMLRQLLADNNFVGGYPGFMFRRASLAAKDGLDERLRIASDYDLICWLCTQGQVAFIPQIHYLRRLHGGNLSDSPWPMLRELARVRARYVARDPKLRKEAGLTSSPAGELAARLGLPSLAEVRQRFLERSAWLAGRCLPQPAYRLVRAVFRRLARSESTPSPASSEAGRHGSPH
ncbi:MAG: glycosyltransferase family 2 protein [Pirellulales bacterium]